MADVTITAASVAKGTGATIARGRAGASVTAGQALYEDATDGEMKLADSDASAATAAVKGLALHASGDGQPLEWIEEGPVTLGTSPLTAGEPYFLSATAGGICPYADLDTGMRVVHVGYAISASVLYVLIYDTGVTHA